MVDGTYLNTELATSGLGIAPWIALAHCALLAPKLLILRKALRLTSRRTLVVTLLQTGFLLYFPSILSTVHFTDSHTGLGKEGLPLAVYAVWWVVGALPIVYLWADRPSEHGGNPVSVFISRTLLYAPFVSLLVHLGSIHWMYELPLHGSYLTPLVLGAGAHVAHTFTRISSAGRLALRWAVPLIGLHLSSSPTEPLMFTLGESFVVSPLRLALVGAALVLWLHCRATKRPSFGFGAGLALSLGLSGHSLSTMRESWQKIVPETATELGVAAIVAAFAFLALGLAVSLWQPQEE